MCRNSFISSSSSGVFLAGFVVAAGLLLLLGTGLALYLGPPSGDLMRIGRMASLDWRPQQTQPPLVIVANPPVAAPDIRVLGDSFSAANAWQSELGRLTSLHIETWHYNDVRCPVDWLRTAITDQGPRASRILIVQSIEREVLPRFAAPDPACTAPPGKPLAIASDTLHSDHVPALFPIDLRYLLAAARHHFRPSLHQGRHVIRSAVTVDLIDDNLFSHRHARRLAYFQGDDRKYEDWRESAQQAAVETLAGLQALAAAHGKQLLVVIVPDKRSVYAPWVASGQLPDAPDRDLFAALAARMGADANLLPAFREQARRQRDFYRPDDTHLSLDGYRFLASEIHRRGLTADHMAPGRTATSAATGISPHQHTRVSR